MTLLAVVTNRNRVYRWQIPGYCGGNENGNMTFEALQAMLGREFGTFRVVIRKPKIW